MDLQCFLRYTQQEMLDWYNNNKPITEYYLKCLIYAAVKKDYIELLKKVATKVNDKLILLKVLASVANDLPDKQEQVFQAIDIILEGSNSFSIDSYDNLVRSCSPLNPVCHHILQEHLTYNDIIQLKSIQQWKNEVKQETFQVWYPECEFELIRRIKTKRIKTSCFGSSFIHFVVDMSMKTGSTNLLNYAVEEHYSGQDVMMEKDSKNRTVIDKLMNIHDSSYRRIHRTNCILAFALHNQGWKALEHGTSQQYLNKQSKKNYYARFFKSLKNYLDRKPCEQVKEEVILREKKARVYVSGRKSTDIEYMHRTKNEGYWESVVNEHNGVLPRYPKKDFGSTESQAENHHGCPLNDIVKGVFFVVNDEKSRGYDRKKSPFGKVRWYKPISDLYYNNNLNYFFADFYCVSKSTVHYVLIAVTEKNTIEDYFCHKTCSKLDMYDNPFFKFKNDGSGQGTCTDAAWVYLFYMGNIVLNDDRNSTMFEVVKKFSTNRKKRRGHGGSVHDPRFCSTCRIGGRPPKKTEMKKEIKKIQKAANQENQ